jgi:hypothetical protein
MPRLSAEKIERRTETFMNTDVFPKSRVENQQFFRSLMTVYYHLQVLSSRCSNIRSNTKTAWTISNRCCISMSFQTSEVAIGERTLTFLRMRDCTYGMEFP